MKRTGTGIVQRTTTPSDEKPDRGQTPSVRQPQSLVLPGNVPAKISNTLDPTQAQANREVQEAFLQSVEERDEPQLDINPASTVVESGQVSEAVSSDEDSDSDDIAARDAAQKSFEKRFEITSGNADEVVDSFFKSTNDLINDDNEITLSWTGFEKMRRYVTWVARDLNHLGKWDLAQGMIEELIRFYKSYGTDGNRPLGTDLLDPVARGVSLKLIEKFDRNAQGGGTRGYQMEEALGALVNQVRIVEADAFRAYGNSIPSPNDLCDPMLVASGFLNMLATVKVGNTTAEVFGLLREYIQKITLVLVNRKEQKVLALAVLEKAIEKMALLVSQCGAEGPEMRDRFFVSAPDREFVMFVQEYCRLLSEAHEQKPQIPWSGPHNIWFCDPTVNKDFVGRIQSHHHKQMAYNFAKSIFPISNREKFDFSGILGAAVSPVSMLLTHSSSSSSSSSTEMLDPTAAFRNVFNSNLEVGAENAAAVAEYFISIKIISPSALKGDSSVAVRNIIADTAVALIKKGQEALAMRLLSRYVFHAAALAKHGVELFDQTSFPKLAPVLQYYVNWIEMHLGYRSEERQFARQTDLRGFLRKAAQQLGMGPQQLELNQV